MKKRFMSLAIATVMLCGTVPAFADYTFSDIAEPQYDWCAPQIRK